MVVQYPHTLNTTILTTNAVQDDLGNWSQPAGTPTPLQLPCRAEPNGNRSIVLPDGTQHVFAFVVYMPLSNPDIPVGSTISITDVQARQVAKGAVKQFTRGQLNCRLWL